MENIKIKEFTDLEAWKMAHELTLAIYRLSQSFPKEEMYGVTSQIRRSAVSVSANIAEGFSRYHFNDKIKFYYNARGSAAETQSLLCLAKDLKYLNNKDFAVLFQSAKNVGMLINGLIRSIEKNK